jgi:hypothetical protein
MLWARLVSHSSEHMGSALHLWPLTRPRNAEWGKRRRSDLSQMAAKGAALRLSVANALVISDRLVAEAVLPRSWAAKVVAAWLMAP